MPVIFTSDLCKVELDPIVLEEPMAPDDPIALEVPNVFEDPIV